MKMCLNDEKWMKIFCRSANALAHHRLTPWQKRWKTEKIGTRIRRWWQILGDRFRLRKRKRMLWIIILTFVSSISSHAVCLSLDTHSDFTHPCKQTFSTHRELRSDDDRIFALGFTSIRLNCVFSFSEVKLVSFNKTGSKQTLFTLAAHAFV